MPKVEWDCETAMIEDIATWPAIARARVMGKDGRSHALLQGYPRSGFVRLIQSGIESPEPFNHDWSLFWDIRAFGEEGEWHAWRANGVWRARFRKRTSGGIERRYVLWGTRVERKDGWHSFTEQRGTLVQVPSELMDDAAEAELVMHLLVRTDPESGVAGIADAMILGVGGRRRE